MRIFVSYSFRDENAWVEHYVVPLIRCFGHTPVTGRILDAGAIHNEIMRKIQSCRRVLCFVTRAKENYGPGGGDPISYGPPDWVRDELMMARAKNLSAIEFRESGVDYGGAAAFESYHPFDRTDLPGLLLQLAEILKDWPVGPLQLRLSVPDALRDEIVQAANAGTLTAQCRARDLDDQVVSEGNLEVRVRDGQLTVPFWINPDPNLAVEIQIQFGNTWLGCAGLSPIVREAPLKIVRNL
jgi:hypothetical protein